MTTVVLRKRSSRASSSSSTGVATSTTGAACVVVLSLALGACSGGGKKHDTTTSGPKSTVPKVLAVKTSLLKVGKVDVESAGPANVQIDAPTGKAVLAGAQKYIDDAVFAPLKGGRLGGGYDSLFDPGVKSVAIGADKRVLTDLDVGKVTRLSTKATPVGLSALAGTLGELLYVATNFDLTVTGVGPTGPLTIKRAIELTFARTAKSWLVTAYRVKTVRHLTTGTTTTTATGATKP
jgi:hypothetical protein